MIRLNRNSVLLACLIALESIACLSGGKVSAQTFAGVITGQVTDAQGAAVPDATVSLTNTMTQEVRKTTTGPDGRYTFARLLPSSYRLQVTHVGFQEYERSGIQLLASHTLELDVTLVVGSTQQTVTVNAAAPLIDTNDANRSMTLTTSTIQALPLNARNAVALVHTSAGVVSARTGMPGTTPDQNTNRFSLNGSREEDTQVLLDGIPMLSPDWGGLMVSPAVDAVQEMQIVRSTYDAEYGRTGGGVINIITRSGGPEYHGGAFEFLRNSAMDANNFFNNRAGKPNPLYHRNQFGGTFGGPVWKSKRLFGFFSYDGVRAGAPTNRLTTVPTPLQRSGDFSQTFNADGSLDVIYDPLTTRTDPNRPGHYIRSPFAGNKIPSTRFDPVAVNVMNLFPTPNQPGDPRTGANNWYGAGVNTNVYNRYEGRVDWAPTEKYTTFLGFTIARENDNPAILFSPAAETNYFAHNPREEVTWGNTFILSPTFVVNVLAGGARWIEGDLSPAAGNEQQQLGFPSSVYAHFADPAPPTFSFANYTSLGYGRLLWAVRNVFTVMVGATKEVGDHSIKFGYMYQPNYMNFTDANTPGFSFNQFFTSGPDPDAKIATAGNSIASLLLGTGASGSLGNPIEPAAKDPYHGFYIQDSWKVTPKLTLNYGLRYEIQGGRTERYNRFTQWNGTLPNPLGPQVGLPLTGGVVFMNANNREQWDSKFLNFAPRIGIAYRLTDRLVMRTGYGIFFDRTTFAGPLGTGNDGFSSSTPWTTSLDGGRTPYAYLHNPFPDGYVPITGSSLGALTNVGQSLSEFTKNRPIPYIQQYSFDFEYQLGSDMMIEVGYAGTLGRKLVYGYGVQLDQLPDKYLALGSQLLQLVPNPFYGVITSGPLSGPTIQYGQLLRPYPQFTGVSITFMPGASSEYNAFVTHFVKRLSHGITLDASYQFSKAMDNSSQSGAPGLVDGARDFNNLAQEWSISSSDQPNSFAIDFVADLPFGHGRAIGSNWPTWLNAVLGGWQISGLYTLASGLPTFFTAPNNTNSFGGNQKPNVNLQQVNQVQRSLTQWFNVNAFSQPAPYTFGNAPRWLDSVRFSAYNNLDAALAKNFQVTERLRAQLRGEFFNAANRTQFGWPDANLGDTIFGQVTGTAPGFTPRNIQVGLRLSF